MSHKIKAYESYPGTIVGKITATGKSAYESWLDQGNVGTLQEFLDDLKSGGDKHHVHKQPGASNTWTITHDLNKYPSVTVVDSGYTVVYGSIEYISKNELTITFTDPFAGEAYLN